MLNIWKHLTVCRQKIAFNGVQALDRIISVRLKKIETIQMCTHKSLILLPVY